MIEGRPRSLPIAPRARPALRHLPLAGEARDVDRAWRPVYAVWELTLKCDLACGHCGSRAGRTRPDELDTAECLDLVGQLAALGVVEVTVIGGEAYLRDDWLTIVRAIRDAGMRCSMTTGGRGVTAELARAGAEAGLRSTSVSIDGNKATHDRLRGLSGAYRSALAAAGHLKAAGIGLAVNTQINRLSMGELPDVLETIIALGARAWQIQLTVAMGRAADALTRPPWARSWSYPRSAACTTGTSASPPDRLTGASPAVSPPEIDRRRLPGPRRDASTPAWANT